MSEFDLRRFEKAAADTARRPGEGLESYLTRICAKAGVTVGEHPKPMPHGPGMTATERRVYELSRLPEPIPLPESSLEAALAPLVEQERTAGEDYEATDPTWSGWA